MIFVVVAIVAIDLTESHGGHVRELHWHLMVGWHAIKLTHWELSGWSIGILRSWGHLFVDLKISLAASKFWLIPLIMMFCFAILYALVVDLTDILFDIGCFLGMWFYYFEFTFTFVWIHTLILTWLCFVLYIFIVHDWTLLDHALHCLWFFLQVISLMDIFYYLFILAFDIFDLLFQVLKLHM